MKEIFLDITKRQKQVLRILYDYIKSVGFPPSFEELKQELGISSNQSLLDLLRALEGKKFIEREEGTARAIRILPEGFRVLGASPFVPIAGTTAAGSFVEAIEEIGAWQELSREVQKLNLDDAIILRVTGDSMTNASIDDGDLILVKRAREFNSGDIVLASSDNGTTVKRFVSENRRLFLKPENPNHKNITFTEDVRLLGKAFFNVTKNQYVR